MEVEIFDGDHVHRPWFVCVYEANFSEVLPRLQSSKPLIRDVTVGVHHLRLKKYAPIGEGARITGAVALAGMVRPDVYDVLQLIAVVILLAHARTLMALAALRLRPLSLRLALQFLQDNLWDVVLRHHMRL